MFRGPKKNVTNTNEQQNKKEPDKVPIPPSQTEFLSKLKETIHSPADLVVKYISETVTITFLDFLIDGKTLNEQILPTLEKVINTSPKVIKESLLIAEVDLVAELNQGILEMLIGAVLIHVEGHSELVIAKISSYQSRGLSAPENESQVIGSQVGFNENIATNISLIRRYITNPNLCNEKFTVGKDTRTSLSVLYIDGIAAEEHVNTVRQRISDLDILDLLDSAVLSELIDDNSISMFPQFLLTERPDRFCDGLLSGKVGIVVNGSSMAILCPYSFIEFFQSREDQNLRWPIATFIRLLRFSAILISIFFTPIYVAALTFHYEVIPQPLLVPLSESRAIVPFPPIVEALVLELIIELLREAGARLPTKVGQTIGIVGGIVLGTAAVQAGITSNILIIIIALCALSSFTTPNYLMGNVIRILRFPVIILAGFWGFLGIMLAFCFIMIHLLRQSSLGAPYMAPIYPPRWKDWSDSFVRLPLPLIRRQSVNSRETHTIQNTNDSFAKEEKVIE
ncbi:spore germination protein [Ureibacillus aquaedulcis]|uniref:Spore germination protein n=1 Tax=Ureibacillus aquaedulcis TaxID=3058421 RepID=A0ABT8GMC7_9BACL|nr:spore germination protein [Ureibacillus sp. BA0131]MDN4492568.1 spore germination protein [Ureibacillus sp. BA0131]